MPQQFIQNIVETILLIFLISIIYIYFFKNKRNLSKNDNESNKNKLTKELKSSELFDNNSQLNKKLNKNSVVENKQNNSTKAMNWVSTENYNQDNHILDNPLNSLINKSINEQRNKVDLLIDIPQAQLSHLNNNIDKHHFPTTKANILVVDDAFVVRKKVGDLLLKNNFNVILKNDGVEALSYLNDNIHQLPDIIITDIEMPNMNGFQLIESIKKSNNMLDLRIIVISSHIDLHLNLMEQGTIDGFISKPFNNDDLLNQLDYLIS